MEVLFSINQKRQFTIEEARSLLPVIYRITEDAQKELRFLVNRMDALKGSQPLLIAEIEEEISRLVDRWNSKIEKLGGTPKGVWLADFDSGKGYYCWKFPENDIKFHHGYQDGFSGRVSIESLDS
ncbi:MAG: DUF2203 domain-containing protein [Proteobacteria bacterium]|jgi:hypothetical protein|nr:DUF2203 domain-containing protein [Pseudomonadota bacterium]